MAESSFSSDDDVDVGRRPAKSSLPTVSHKLSLNNNNADECSSKKVADGTETQTTFKNFPGVRKRKSGKWSAEIRDPFVHRRIWLGTFNTPQEASNAYVAKKLEIRERKQAECQLGRSGGQNVDEKNRSGKCIDAERNWNRSGEQIDARGEEQNDAGLNWEPILTDSNEFLLGEFSNLDDDLTSLNKFRGAYRRTSGRWSAEIRDPFIHRKLSLGTFDTPQEASNAYAAKKLEFSERKEAECHLERSGEQIYAEWNRSGKQNDVKLNRNRNWSRKQIDVRSGEQIDAGLNWEPILTDSNRFLLGDEFSNLDDDLTALNKFRGAYRRPSGRWSSEIRDPITHRRICLGTFDTPQEASNAHAAKKLEFRERKEAESCINSTRLECDSLRSGAGLNPEPILVDSNGFLLGEFSNLDDDLIIS